MVIQVLGVCLLLLAVMGLPSGNGEPYVVDVTEINETHVAEALQRGSPVILLGEQPSSNLNPLNTSLRVWGESDATTKTVMLGAMWERNMEHSLVVKSYEYNESLDMVYIKWLNDALNTPKPPYPMMAVRTEIEYQEPYGILETRTELVKVNDTSTQYDWYDITVSQTLTPIANTSESDWEWKTLTYTMNGTKGTSNIVLTDYDDPSIDPPSGFFSFLWHILRFDLRTLLPWLYPKPLQVEGIDHSDYSCELYLVQYQAPDGYPKSNEPLTVQHHMVLRVKENTYPRFWQQTQITYLKGNVIAAPVMVSPLLHEGYMELR